jgi:hypothetical protein
VESSQLNFKQQIPTTSLRLSDLKFISSVGKGSSGVVQKTEHVPTGKMYAVKVKSGFSEFSLSII